MAAGTSKPAVGNMPHGDPADDQRRRIRRTAVVLALVALGIYVGFVVLSLLQGRP